MSSVHVVPRSTAGPGRVEVTCPECHRTRSISVRTHRKWHRTGPRPCIVCRLRLGRARPSNAANWLACASPPPYPDRPTSHPPGSLGKVAVMAQRFDRGEAVLHPLDAVV